ncbi:hypothetical protein THTE_1764 [Thermogutta terrifontis]|uniref:Uncharacterized protein n=1 Tax=Thermogutta terrifontis TaxID=1331910 RepID=A0A286REH3_9BACT|nr:hypothetical protein [Thermogutta terrifontis]ASV74366.1 hypothetical protein THTE_1764 [Thermogutta terrifontis]
MSAEVCDEKNSNSSVADAKSRLRQLRHLWGDALEEIRQSGLLLTVQRNSGPVKRLHPLISALATLNKAIIQLEKIVAAQDAEEELEKAAATLPVDPELVLFQKRVESESVKRARARRLNK